MDIFSVWNWLIFSSIDLKLKTSLKHEDELDKFNLIVNGIS